MLPPPLQLLLMGIYIVGTGVCNVANIASISEAGSRAARLSLLNLIPTFISLGQGFGARYLGVSRSTYRTFHTVCGFMALVQGAIHVSIVARTRTISASNDVQFYGILVGSMMLGLSFLPLVKKRVYEVFLRTHQGCALVLLYALWRHVQMLQVTETWICLLACTCLAPCSLLIQLARIIYRNFVKGKRRAKLIRIGHGEDVACIRVSLPRPWQVRAGEHVWLNVPGLGLFYLFQFHPFTVTWWDEDDTGEICSISLLVQSQAGFTKKLLQSTMAGEIYMAHIDGPYGPATVGPCGLSERMGDYGHIFMVATGIGIAAQLPYIKELLEQRRNSRIRTQRIALVWQLEQEGDWKSARDWLQLLVKQDDHYLLSVTVYDSLKPPSPSDPLSFGYHDLIKIYGGQPTWEDHLSSEVSQQNGRMLVAGTVYYMPVSVECA
ncbi:hypothetical protein BO86DRAFT_315251 [Aspergillus japonicus CBS 114.51]|uniref:ferric-chelate reductase (NADPH) n=1 Tax=Aspergillus japonicus CBS 114.51 TaxID=1448312 RepID=A0A8T8WYJ3_ASPJA|nr:hypothetical protein BO86DRAFT_315251 [Aspergillus japonicus CBS 114.51]RAH80885.1 hypothetical protein BO86DRAFT_315251 [Aspergillus japonicus CBS 114.51]